MGKTNTKCIKTEFYFNDKKDMYNFILLYKDMFHPWSVFTKGGVIFYSTKWKTLDDPQVRKMADEGYVISGNAVTTNLTKEEREYIFNNLEFEKIRYGKNRYYYRYVSEKVKS